jgi:hypothetical protein
MGDQEYNIGKKYRQKGTLCGPNRHRKLTVVHSVKILDFCRLLYTWLTGFPQAAI